MQNIAKVYAPICKCNGCPLPATVVTNYWPKDKKRDKPKPRYGVCEYHHTAPGDQWTETTKRINDNKKILQIVNAVQKINDPRYKPVKCETIDTWLNRVTDTLRKEILNIKLTNTSQAHMAQLHQMTHPTTAQIND